VLQRFKCCRDSSVAEIQVLQRFKFLKFVEIQVLQRFKCRRVRDL